MLKAQKYFLIFSTIIKTQDITRVPHFHAKLGLQSRQERAEPMGVQKL